MALLANKIPANRKPSLKHHWENPAKQSRVTVFTYPVERMAVPQNETQTAVTVSNPSLKLRHWCLTVSYSIIFSSELLISIDGNLIWSSEGITTGPYREKISINIPGMDLRTNTPVRAVCGRSKYR